MDRDETRKDKQGDAPSDTEALVGDTAASDKLTDRTRVQPSEVDAREHDDKDSKRQHADGKSNPPSTTTGKVTSPAFGSGISGGALADPGPPRD